MSNTPVTLPSERAALEQQQAQATVFDFIQSLRPEIQRALPRGLDADRMARLALTVVRKTPKLAVCTRESFAGALLSAAALGLEPGVEGEAYLVPYEDRKRRVVECQLQIGYQGYSKLFWQHPLARGLDAQAVYEADDFDYAYGTDPFLRHKPARGDRGDVIYYYAVAQMAHQASRFVVLTPEEVRKIRQGRVGPSGDIPDPQHWMERKTPLRQLFKLVPKSARLTEALVVDEQPGTELRRRLDTQHGIDQPTEAHPPAPAGTPRSGEERQLPSSPEPAVDTPTGEVVTGSVEGAEPAHSTGGAGTTQVDARSTPGPDPAPDPGEVAAGPETTAASPATRNQQPRRPASKAKMRLIEARLDDLGVDKAPEERAYVLGTLLNQASDYTPTAAEADALLETLNRCKTKQDLWTALDQLDQPTTHDQQED